MNSIHIYIYLYYRIYTWRFARLPATAPALRRQRPRLRPLLPWTSQLGSVVYNHPKDGDVPLITGDIWYSLIKYNIYIYIYI